MSSWSHNEDFVKQQLNSLIQKVSQVNAKLVGIKFRIERKCIKNEAREQRRRSIHQLEMDKNLKFHPKKERSKSTPHINMNVRLKCLKDIKEDLILNRTPVPNEILDDEFEQPVPILSYNYNNINREILKMPDLEEIIIPPRKKRLIASEEREGEQIIPSGENNGNQEDFV